MLCCSLCFSHRPRFQGLNKLLSQPQRHRQLLTNFVLDDGTPIKLRLNRTLSSADAKTGDNIDFEVLEEVKVGDVLVIPKGSIAIGTITDAEHKKRMARGGKLDIEID